MGWVIFIGVILLTAIALLFTSAYALPLTLLMGVIYFELIFRLRPENVFGLTPEQAAEIQESEDERKSIYLRVRELKQAGGDLRINRDGTYDRRNPYGEMLNNELPPLVDAMEELDESTGNLRQLPLKALKRFHRLSSMRAASAWAVFAWIAMAIVTDVLYGAVFYAHSAALVVLLVIYILVNVHFRSVDSQSIAAFKQLAQGGEIGPEHILGELQTVSIEAEGTKRNDNTGTSDETEEPEPSPETKEIPASHHVWHEVLGVSVNATADDINTAWREKIKKAHPDLVAESDSDFQELAEAKAKDINVARAEGLSLIRHSDHANLQSAIVDPKTSWIKKATPGSLAAFEAVMALVRKAGKEPRISYNQNYITAGTDGSNFLWFSPNKDGPSCPVTLKVGQKERSDFVRKFSEAGIVAEPRQANGFRVNLTAQQIAQQEALLNEAIKVAAKFSQGSS